MNGTAIPMNPFDANPKASPALNGTLSITTDPSPVAILVFDNKMHAVAEGVSPVQVELAPGLYMVRATMAGRPDLIKMAWVVSNSARSVHLSEAEPNLVQIATSMFSGLLDKYVRKLDVLPSQSVTLSVREPEIRPYPFWIRFSRLTDWNGADPAVLPKMSSNYVRGRAILDVTNPQQNVVFAQITGNDRRVLNVAIPPAGTRQPVRCQLVVCAEMDMLTADVRLSTEWANAAMHYMAEGYLNEAKQLVAEGIKRQPSGLDWLFQKIANRLEDPAAAFVPRYIELRTREATGLNAVGESLLDLFQKHLSDGDVISAELFARARQFKLAAQYIIGVPPGGIPLFTEGFSLLIHRVRELLDLDPATVTDEQRLTVEQVEKLQILKRTLNKWAPYLNLNRPTVTFFGNDITAPRTTESPVVPTEADGWIRGPKPPKA